MTDWSGDWAATPGGVPTAIRSSAGGDGRPSGAPPACAGRRRPRVARRGLDPLLPMVLSALGCTTVLPAPRVPDRIAPTIRNDLGAPADGHGRVVLDVVDGPTEVREVLSESESSSVAVASNNRGTVAVASGQASEQTTRPLCTTPCVTDLLRGNHVLSFTLVGEPRRTERGDVLVGQRVWVQRRALGQPRRLAPTTVGIGIAVAVLGLVIEGSAFAFIGESTGTALALLGAGAGIALGGVGIMLSNATSQPGSVAEWYLDETQPTGAARSAPSTAPASRPVIVGHPASPSRRPTRRAH